MQRRSIGGGRLWGPIQSQHICKRNSTFIIPSLVPSVGLWEGLGCYKSVDIQRLDIELIFGFSDSTTARALQVRVDAGNTTVESCVAACQAQGFSLAGVEFGRECCESIYQTCVSWVCLDESQGAVQSFSMAQYSTAMTMAFDTGISVRAQMALTATWVVKETLMRPAAGLPCWTCIILPEHTLSGPPWCRL